MIVHQEVESAAAALRSDAKPPAVVVGLCTHGLAIVRSLSRRGVPVLALESNWTQPSARTRYGTKLHVASLADGPLLERLEAIGSRAARKPVLFVTNDRMVRLLNARQEEIRRRFHIPFPRPDLLDTLIEKDSLTPLAERQGLRMPRSWTIPAEALRPGADSPLPEGLAFPCIVKPATPMSSLKVMLAPNRDALRAAARDHADVDRFLVQEWIEGDDQRIYFAAYYFDREGRVRWPFVGQKIRQVPRTLGNSTAARGVARPDLLEEGLKLFRGLDYRGIASVEFKLAPDGTPFFIEATVGRSDFWLKTLLVNGIDLPALVYSELTGVELGADGAQRNRCAWVDEDRDWRVFLESVADRRIPRARLLRELFEPKRYALLDVRDPAPYAAWCGPFLGRLAGALRHRVTGGR